MDPYLVSLLLGGTGLAAMALSGIGRHGDASHGSHGHGHDAGSHGVQAHNDGHIFGALRGAGRTGARSARGGGRGSQWVLALMSPKLLFSVLLGLGTTGIVLRGLLSGMPLLLAAIAGGLALERIVVTPLWNLTLRFASRPALTLEHAIAEPATAVTAFDGNGEGLVSVELDGQVIQLLGRLAHDDRSIGVRVRAGDRLTIQSVDTARNRCTVSAH